MISDAFFCMCSETKRRMLNHANVTTGRTWVFQCFCFHLLPLCSTEEDEVCVKPARLQTLIWHRCACTRARARVRSRLGDPGKKRPFFPDLPPSHSKHVRWTLVTGERASE